MKEKVKKVKLPEGSKYQRVEVAEDGTINIFYTEMCREETTKTAQRPTEGKWFEVNPLAISQELFKEKRKDSNQEKTRKLILDAFIEVDKNPEKYSKPFFTMMPEKTWILKTIEEHKEYAKEKGDHIANRVEQSLEWAQRIANGESWEAICNEPDTASYFRLVEWAGEAKVVGGSLGIYQNYPACNIDDYKFGYNFQIFRIVPLIVLYK